MLIAACDAAVVPRTTTPPPRGTVQAGGALRVALDGRITTLDPQNAGDASTVQVTRQIFETLVDEVGGRIVPKLAESWSVSADGRTWTLSLRRGVKFHDGTDLDAAAVVASFDRARLTTDALRGPPSADRFAAFAALWGGFDGASVLVKVEAKDPATVVFTTRVPFGPFLSALAAPASAIVSPASLRQDPIGWAGIGSRGAAGTGPFVFRPGAWQGDGEIALERNPAYWAKDQAGTPLPYLERVVFRALPDEATRVAALRAGDVDAVRDLSPAALTAVRADPKLEVLARPALGVVYLGLRRSMAPFDRLEARRAVAAALDEDALASAAFAGEAKAATQFVAPGTLGYDDTILEFARQDTAAARRLLADAGHAQGLEVDLYYPTAWRPAYVEARRVAESVAADLARIGINATPRATDGATLRADAGAGRFALWLDDWIGASADPDASLGALFASADPVIGELLRQARSETDESKRGELYKQVSKLVQRDALAIPLVHPSPPLVVSRKVRGLVPLRGGGEALTGVWIGR